MIDQPSQKHLFTYWDGPISWLERLCIKSMLDAGNTLTIYSYDPEYLAKIGLHSDIRDARDIVPENSDDFIFRTAFSNLFRLVGQIQCLGTWVDLDCYFLKRLDEGNEYCFGWASDRKLNGAVMRLPANSEMAKDYLAGITRVPLRLPWATFRRRLLRDLEIMFGRQIPKSDRLTNFGPRALTYYAKLHGKLSLAQPIDVFYPLPSKQAVALTDKDDRTVQSMITQNTIIIHAWHTRLRKNHQLDELPHPSSFFGAALKKHGY